MNYKKLELNEVLYLLEQPEAEDKPYLFINTTGALETFFKYKGNLSYFIDFEKELEQDPLAKTRIKNEILKFFEYGMKSGSWTVIDIGPKTSFNLMGLLKNCDFDNEDMLLPSHIKNIEYCLTHNIITKQNTKDIFEIKKSFKLLLLSTCKETEIADLLKNNPKINANIIIII